MNYTTGYFSIMDGCVGEVSCFTSTEARWLIRDGENGGHKAVDFLFTDLSMISAE